MPKSRRKNPQIRIILAVQSSHTKLFFYFRLSFRGLAQLLDVSADLGMEVRVLRQQALETLSRNEEQLTFWADNCDGKD